MPMSKKRANGERQNAICRGPLTTTLKCNFRPLKWPIIAGSRSFEVKCTDKVPLNPSNVPTKFRWNNQNTDGKQCKKAISDPKKWLPCPEFEVV